MSLNEDSKNRIKREIEEERYRKKEFKKKDKKAWIWKVLGGSTFLIFILGFLLQDFIPYLNNLRIDKKEKKEIAEKKRLTDSIALVKSLENQQREAEEFNRTMNNVRQEFLGRMDPIIKTGNSFSKDEAELIYENISGINYTYSEYSEKSVFDLISKIKFLTKDSMEQTHCTLLEKSLMFNRSLLLDLKRYSFTITNKGKILKPGSKKEEGIPSINHNDGSITSNFYITLYTTNKRVLLEEGEIILPKKQIILSAKKKAEIHKLEKLIYDYTNYINN